MCRFSLRWLFALVAIAAILESLYLTIVLPARKESIILDELTGLGAHATGVSIIPSELARVIDPDRWQHASTIDLRTPQATIAYLDSNHVFSKLQSITLVGLAVDLEALKNDLRLHRVRKIRLDSTAITKSQHRDFKSQHPGIQLTRDSRWAHNQIMKLGRFPSYEIDNPLILIQAVNHFRTVGREITIDTLESYVSSRRVRDQTRIRRLIPMLFLRRDLSEKFPLPGGPPPPDFDRLIRSAANLNELLDQLEKLDSIERSQPPEDAFYLGADKWPIWDDVYCQREIVFYVPGVHIGGYSLPSPGQQAYLVRWAELHGRFINLPVTPIDDPRAVRPKLLGAFARRRPYRNRTLAAQQIDTAIEQLIGGLKGPTRWNSRLQRYEDAR